MYTAQKCLVALSLAVVWPCAASAQNKADSTKDKKAAADATAAKPAKPAEPAANKDAQTKTPPAAAAPAAGAAKPAEGAEAAPPAGATGADQPMNQGTYTVQLRDLEDRINRLKEQIFRSKARLSLLAETVLDRKIAGSKATIVFRNEMGGSFRLVKATFSLDGGPIFNKADDSGGLSEREMIDLFDGPVMPGDHTLSVVLHYRGHGFGIFSYLQGYSFKTKSSRTFTINEGKALKLDVVGYEKGGVTTPLEERPGVRYVENIMDYEGGAASSGRDAGKEGGK